MKRIQAAMGTMGVVVVMATAPFSLYAQGTAEKTAVDAPASRMEIEQLETHAQVVELDIASREVTLQMENGDLVSVNVPDYVKNFNQVQVGDKIFIRYNLAVAASLEKVAKDGLRKQEDRAQTLIVNSDDKKSPGVTKERTIEILAQIEALDSATRMATLRSVKRVVKVKVPNSIDIQKLKVGDSVHAIFIEALALSVEHTKTNP